MNYQLYEGALQVVPLLLIALFLDRRIPQTGTSRQSRRLQRWSSKFSLLLNAIALLASLFVVAGIIEPSSVTLAVVISAVAGSIGLLCGQIWQRIEESSSTPDAGPDPGPGARADG